MSSLEQHSNRASPCCNTRTVVDSIKQPTNLTVLDRYTALRNHRMRFQDALDPNAERVTTLRKHDIIFGRGKNMQDYPGNRKMRSVIDRYKQQYHSLERYEKRDLIELVYKELVHGGARFLTKAPDDEHFVVVDVEVALQKVGNTLRCRKSWNKKMNKKVQTSTNINGENVCTPLKRNEGPNSSQRKTAVMTTARDPHVKNSIQTFARLPQVSQLVLRHRSQTMSLLRENTIRLMQQQPLRPATAGDVIYLHQRNVASWARNQVAQRNSQPVAPSATKNGILLKATNGDV